MIHDHTTILFQGDSITDANREREPGAANNNAALGQGYPNLIAAELLGNAPKAGYTIYNRGISGNRIVDLFARIRIDTINLKPDLLSVLIGVNDTWHNNRNNGVPVPKYELVYRMFLAEIREHLPSVQFVLCEPFVLHCGVVANEWPASWIEEMDQRRTIVRTLADDFSATFVPFQSAFDEAVKAAPPEHWAADGVHPSLPGHQVMAKAWLEAVC